MDAALIPAFQDVLVVAQTGAVAEAARRLHKTSSAVSQQIHRVEQRFGVTLFDRVGRRLRPSPAGEALLGALTRLFSEATSVEALLEELASARVTTQRVASADYLGEALRLPIVRRLLDEYLGRTGRRPTSTIDVPSVSLLLSYVSSGLGVGLAPSLAANRIDRAKVVVEPAGVPDVEVRLMLYPALKRTPGVRRFIDELVAEAKRATTDPPPARASRRRR